MKSYSLLTAVAVGTMTLTHHARAHGFAGDHMFVSTLIIDDPNVSDEATLPTFSYLPQPTDSGSTPRLYGLNFEFDKRITENFGFGINQGHNWLTRPGAKTTAGWSNLVVTLKYKLYVNPEHEFMMSAGVQRQFARTGTNGTNGAVLDNDDSSSTTPLIYFGKGFGDLPIGYQHLCRGHLRRFEAMANRRSHRWFRLFNEISVLLFAATVVLAVVKPF